MLFTRHNLSVSDTLGPLAMLALALWNTLLGRGWPRALRVAQAPIDSGLHCA